jgi:hypothetical protein
MSTCIKLDCSCALARQSSAFPISRPCWSLRSRNKRQVGFLGEDGVVKRLNPDNAQAYSTPRFERNGDGIGCRANLRACGQGFCNVGKVVAKGVGLGACIIIILSISQD